MSSSAPATQVMLLFSLSETPRNKLLEWYEDVCAQARGLCAAFDIAGTLSLVAYPTEWNAYPGNLTNAADVLANGDPPDFRARPTFAQPMYALSYVISRGCIDTIISISIIVSREGLAPIVRAYS